MNGDITVDQLLRELQDLRSSVTTARPEHVGETGCDPN